MPSLVSKKPAEPHKIELTQNEDILYAEIVPTVKQNESCLIYAELDLLKGTEYEKPVEQYIIYSEVTKKTKQ